MCNSFTKVSLFLLLWLQECVLALFVLIAEYDWQISEATGVASDYTTDMITFLCSTFESFTNLPVSISLIDSCYLLFVFHFIVLSKLLTLSRNFSRTCCEVNCRTIRVEIKIFVKRKLATNQRKINCEYKINIYWICQESCPLWTQLLMLHGLICSVLKC